jgi:hypothetical protein
VAACGNLAGDHSKSILFVRNGIIRPTRLHDPAMANTAITPVKKNSFLVIASPESSQRILLQTEKSSRDSRIRNSRLASFAEREPGD